MFASMDTLLSATRVRPRDIRNLIVNCGILNTTPSLSATLINHYKLKHNVQSFNLGGMGCAGGIVAIDLAKDLLGAYPGTYARQLVRTHKDPDDRSYKSIWVKEDENGNLGISVSKDVVEVGGHALKANITTLGSLVLPVSEQFHFFTSSLFRNKKSNSRNSNSMPCIPDFKLTFEHICILATSKKVPDEIQKNLELTEEYMEASRKTLERFRNTSSSSVWYELAYLEANYKVKKGDRIWQIAFGSGFKCNSVVWKALRSVKSPKNRPWLEDKP